eukprot:TRINITY_DN17410_c0_g1_i1.p1 TRINITY_DN17410_c0_g1~~TRINITY_DN17410_c0_g1_i1.p1  ORF type:complete len:513 (-),score=40.92 TRINITY_DN17410_c0_g1_i1:7-1356(-)
MEPEAEDKDAENYFYLRSNFIHVASMNPQVLVIQPFIRNKADQPFSHVDLQLEESLALVNTLKWKVVDAFKVGLDSYSGKEFFRSGKMEEISNLISQDQRITNIYISVYKLSHSQRLALESHFRVPVIDRYSLVLQIFHLHARTVEAKLQVSLAEMPYLKHRLDTEYFKEQHSKHSGGNLGESVFESRSFALKQMESRIKKKIDKFSLQRQKLRESKQRSVIPTVAIVGYTNCGKTSLIKALTGEETLKPENKLFATLDVTCHSGSLPDNLQCIYVDTVGFLSDIPTKLIASFSATLEDAIQADLVVHVRDLSHPDTVHQGHEVMKTLSKLNFKPTDVNIITVANKIDKIKKEDIKVAKSEGLIPISATLNIGLAYLQKEIQERLISIREIERTVIRIKTGSDVMEWLRANTTVADITVDESDQNYCMLSVLWSKQIKGKFEKLFLKRY